jgi:mono/diheme cytochrome c family protein
MPHLSELHGAATHLAVIAIPVYVLVLLARRLELGGDWLRDAEPWVVGAALAGTLLAGATGLLVWGQAQTTLRGTSFRVGTIHFWLGIALTLMTVALVAWRFRRVRTARHTHSVELLGGGVIVLVAVFAQGYLGGRMTYNSGVGVASGGQLAQSASGAARLDAALAQGMQPAKAGRMAFSTSGLGCASCHGALAQGERGPRLAGGRDLADFRRVHGRGLFPPRIVSDRDFAAVDAYLRTLQG